MLLGRSPSLNEPYSDKTTPELPTTTEDTEDFTIQPPVELNTPVALSTLVGCTIFAYFMAEHLVASLNDIVEKKDVSKEWLTLIVVPIVSNAAEHATAVVVAAKGKFELGMLSKRDSLTIAEILIIAVTVAIGSCVQIALFVIPVLVLVAWGLDKPMSLVFDPLETLVSCVTRLYILPHVNLCYCSVFSCPY